MTSKRSANVPASADGSAEPLLHPTPSRPLPSRGSASAEAGAAAPLGANEVVAAYVRGRSEAGLVTDVRLRGMCGRYARQLLASRSWDRDVLLEAVERFGATKRSPRFISEWCSQIVVEREDKAHEKIAQLSESVRPDRSLHRLDVSAVLAQMRAG